MPKSFCELNIWKKGYKLLMEIYDITVTYPKEETYALKSDTRRSANSVIANIAESHGRYYFADKVRTLYISRGEVVETRSHLRVALGRKYISRSTFLYLEKEYEGLNKGINSYIRSLYNQKNA